MPVQIYAKRWGRREPDKCDKTVENDGATQRLCQSKKLISNWFRLRADGISYSHPMTSQRSFFGLIWIKRCAHIHYSRFRDGQVH